MCSPNEFDPILLQMEFKRRKKDQNQKVSTLSKQKLNLKRAITGRAVEGSDPFGTKRGSKLIDMRKPVGATTLKTGEIADMRKSVNL